MNDAGEKSLVMTVLPTPDTVNFSGKIHGGAMLRYLDQVAYACAARYCGAYVVTLAVDQVTFRYGPDEPYVLREVSFSAAPGEFVAIVGPSGAGKSSLLRLLLGFERPELGSIRYDAKEASWIDPVALRRQIGTVVQTAQVLPGDVLSNIIGTRRLSVDDACGVGSAAFGEPKLPRKLGSSSSGILNCTPGRRLLSRSISPRLRGLPFPRRYVIAWRTIATINFVKHDLRCSSVAVSSWTTAGRLLPGIQRSPTPACAAASGNAVRLFPLPGRKS